VLSAQIFQAETVFQLALELNPKVFDGLRDNPRFEELLHRMNLPQN
jgi:hypothetical protein